jgi:hypothetical protein
MNVQNRKLDSFLRIEFSVEMKEKQFSVIITKPWQISDRKSRGK